MSENKEEENSKELLRQALLDLDDLLEHIEELSEVVLYEWERDPITEAHKKFSTILDKLDLDQEEVQLGLLSKLSTSQGYHSLDGIRGYLFPSESNNEEFHLDGRMLDSNAVKILFSIHKFILSITGTDFSSVLESFGVDIYDLVQGSGVLEIMLAENSRSPEELLSYITEHSNFEIVHQYAFENDNCPSERLRWLYENIEDHFLDNADPKELLVRHKKTPIDILQKLIAEEDSDIAVLARTNLASRETISLQELASLALDEAIEVRTAAIKNPLATEEIRASAAILGVG